MAFVADAGVDTGSGAGAVVAMARVDGAFFGADEEGGRVGGGEGHTGWGEVFGFQRGWGRREEFEVFAGLGEHVDGPGAEDAVGGAGDDVVGVLGADDVEGVDWVGVPGGVGACEGGFGDGEGRFGARVPEEDLAAVGTAEDEGGVEGGEFGGEDVGGGVEGVFGTGV